MASVGSQQIRMSLRHSSAILLNSGTCAYDGANIPRRHCWNGPHVSLIWPDGERIALSTASTRMRDRHGYGQIASASSYDNNFALHLTSMLSFSKANLSSIENGYFTGDSTAMMRSGPPVPPAIFIGKAITSNPRSGRSRRLLRFSSTGTFLERSATCVSKVMDWP